MCPLSVLVQHPSGDGDEGDPRWISRWTTNWRANDYNLRYADDIILLATSEAELQELVDRLDQVSRKYSLVLLINVDKTRVMASDSIACHILIQYELLEQVDTFLYHGSLITENYECTTEFHTRLNRGQVIGASLKKIWKSHSISISTKI